MESLSAARENFYVKYIDSEHVKMSRCLQKKGVNVKIIYYNVIP
jgi:hypothetical protein